jgi:hypothetical protein
VNQIFLIPGFFGFTNLGDLHYFGHVERVLTRMLREQGQQAAIHVVPTRPTAGLPERAHALFRCIAEHSEAGDAVHLIGHSTGGLDARLLVSPSLTLPDGSDASAMAQRVRSILCLTTPHHGTPSAAFLTGVQGKPLLKLLSLSTLLTLRQGRLPLQVVLRLGEVMFRLRERTTGSKELVEELYASLLGRLDPERRASLEAFLIEVSQDQTLLTQLSPDAMALFNATTPEPEGVAIGSIVARARRPKLRDLAKSIPRPYRAASQAVFRSFYTLASRGTPRDLRPQAAKDLIHAWGELPTAKDNDGMVPTQSQLWGQTVRAVHADHLDVLGHFSEPQAEPPHYDWLISGSDFDQDRFQALWADAVSFLRPQLQAP